LERVNLKKTSIFLKLRRCDKSLRPWTPVAVLPLGSFQPVEVVTNHLEAISTFKGESLFRRFYPAAGKFSAQVLGKSFIDALAKQVATFLGREVIFSQNKKMKKKKKKITF
jgi:hypothetical protein